MCSMDKYHENNLKHKTQQDKPHEPIKLRLIKAQHYHMAGKHSQAEIIYNEILNDEAKNEMPNDIDKYI